MSRNQPKRSSCKINEVLKNEGCLKSQIYCVFTFEFLCVIDLILNTKVTKVNAKAHEGLFRQPRKYIKQDQLKFPEVVFKVKKFIFDAFSFKQGAFTYLVLRYHPVVVYI
jgi:hypothetical protein